MAPSGIRPEFANDGRVVAPTPGWIQHVAVRGRRRIGRRNDVFDAQWYALQWTAIDTRGKLCVSSLRGRHRCVVSNRDKGGDGLLRGVRALEERSRQAHRRDASVSQPLRGFSNGGR